VAGGGRLCVIGPLATHDEWMRPRPRPALDDLPAAAAVRVRDDEDWLEAIRRACGEPSLSITATDNRAVPAGLCAELTQQPGRRLVHLVNYRADGPARNLVVDVRLPGGATATSVSLVAPERQADRALPYKAQPGSVRFIVPEVDVYEIAVVQFSDCHDNARH